jgi:hypothetical protein
MADVQLDDVVYDMGSGDGRTILMAMREFHATSVGIELNPFWVFWTRVNVDRFRLSGQVNVVWGNFFNQDLSNADIVTLYLLQGTNDQLKRKFENELKPRTRVVSYDFTFDGWKPRKFDRRAHVYLYTI